ncbi:unnamed protein product [Parascedosporium putredinis]|uniref:Uncharacterized protein n=1 Tax=Parascedosporium putredinis TaxID=1442378 RepID=A0A9P1M823_9PEZI|nr:unnamed protein product [Parascedosporium putredinis]CAI7992829.1 unnamed protein product [Parascedosporium putredinis]
MAENVPQTIFRYASKFTATVMPYIASLPPTALTVLTVVACLVVASYVRRIINYLWSFAINILMAVAVAYLARAVYDMGPEKALQMVYVQALGLARFATEAAKFFWREWERYDTEAKKKGEGN